MSKLICIDAGHEEKDTGAVGNGIIEKDVALKVVKMVGGLLEKQGLSVMYKLC